ncbi:MAG: acyl-CoA dehydrogenase [Xanthomonadales bacterium]|nr:acyl-CoA dehydrogenase [Gammaproteobacteria bacterium]NNL05216.1 acyl-CoA dehydrogenase [Xanthomonadales bacterium]
MIWLLILSLVVISMACAFYGTTLLIWTAAMAATIVVFGATGAVSTVSWIVMGLVLAVIAVPLNVKEWRRQLISAPFLKQFRRMLPEISETEQVALDAGTVGWEGELFAGKPNWSKLKKQPYLELTLEEQQFLDGPVEELCKMTDSWEITHVDTDLNPKTWEFLKENRFFGMIIPKEYGGLGFSAMAHRAVLEKISSVCAVTSSTVAVPNSLGPAELLLHYGTEEQKNHFLPRLARGEEIPCFALTGPTAGSDATSIPDYGIVCKGEYKGKQVLGVRLNFDKRYITLAPVASIIGVAFQMYDPDGLLGDNKELGISLALVPRDTEGLDAGKRHFPVNLPFQNGPVRGKDVFVPLEALIGGVEMAGQGWRMLIECLSVGRAITLPATSTGGSKMVARATGAYARIRKQFNLPIGRFEGVEAGLARIAAYTYATSALSRMTTSAVDLGEKPAVPSAIAKYHTTEMARTVIKDAMDIHGGKGVILGPRNYLGRAWEGIPVSITVEGANILTRNLMIFGQGAIRCHPFVLKEMEAARLPDERERVAKFDDLLFAHVGYSIRNAVRSFVLGLSFGKFAKVPHDRKTAKYYKKLSRYSATLAFVSDVSMLVLGGKLKQKEHLSARMGDVLSLLYICSAMLKRYEAEGRPAADQAILAWAFHDAIHRIQIALQQVVDNFPNRPMGALLRFVVFPFGLRERAPGDRLTHRVAQILLSPSDARDRLSRGVFTSAESGHPVNTMEEALPLVIRAEPLDRKLSKALRLGEISGITWEERLRDALAKSVITKEESEIIKDVYVRVSEIIAVDEFDTEDMRAGRRPQPPLGTKHAA